MSDPSENHELVADQFYAQSVLNTVEEFVAEFVTRGELGALQRVVAEEEDLLGGVVGQMPELFTKKQLIRPMLEALGYENIVSEPADLVKDQRSVPDFEVGGVADSCLCIVEVKAFGKLDASSSQTVAEKEITDYLSENALAKYKRDLETKYLIGAATDGLVWVLYGKHLETGEQITVDTASLREPFRQAVLAQQYEDSTGDAWVTEQRPIVKEEFVSLFTAEAASKAVVAELRD